MNSFKQNYPKVRCNNNWNNNCNNQNQDDERFGFLLPFITGAVVSAPFWFVAGNNKGQQQYYQGAYNNQYYQQQSYPMYYPYQNGAQQPLYFPYPPYR